MFLLGRQPAWPPLCKLGLAIVLAVAAVFGNGAVAKAPIQQLETVVLASLPSEAQGTERLIRAGGPFPYTQDGRSFGNRERLLPAQRRGYYREYTVKTPGSRDRGARRIVCGGLQATAPDACFYTADHYTSFRRIVQ
ncbi:MAG: ribonuclease N1 [Rhizobacter sp.]|nr:ribonuclease N1 [Rhizobacter sp.]